MLIVVTAPKIVNVKEIMNSDHRIIVTEWQMNARVKQYRAKKKKRLIYLYGEMNEEKWNDFTDKIEVEITKDNKMEQKITTVDALNKQWNKLEQIIRKVAAEEIPKAKVGPKTFYAFSKKATKLHVALKRINKVIRGVRIGETKGYDSKQINEEIRDIAKLGQIEIGVDFGEQDTADIIRQKVKLLQEYQKMIYKARKLENEITHRQEIEKHIERRYNNFASNTKKMVDSILQRKKEPVEFRNIKKADQVITEPKEIKEEIKEHFEKWTRYNPTNLKEWRKWEETYKPIDGIDERWYEGVDAEKRRTRESREGSTK